MALTPSLPHSFPYAWGGSGASATPDTTFADLVARIGPPWLRRTWATRILGAIASPLDILATILSAGVKARFPVWTSPEALVLIGRERRIRRGPAEPAGVYAPRLIGWWDDHRGRGGPYALIRQLRAYWTGTYDGDLEVVSYLGVRHTMLDGATDITRDVIAWGADGSGEWAQAWIFIRLASDPGTLSPEALADLTSVPSEWSAAHILREHVVLLWGTGRLWDYPPPSGDWDAWESGGTWDDWDASAPIVETHTET